MKDEKNWGMLLWDNVILDNINLNVVVRAYLTAINDKKQRYKEIAQFLRDWADCFDRKE